MQCPEPAKIQRWLLWVLLIGTLLATGCQSLLGTSYSPRSFGLPPQSEGPAE